MKEIVNDAFAKVVKPYIDDQDKKSREIIAPVEVSPAEAPHSIGDQIIFNGILYDVTAAIAVDDSLSTTGSGANIAAADDIEAQIKSAKTQIQTAAVQAAADNKNTQEMIAPVEEDETDASKAYAVGEQLILDGILYDVIDAIAQHGIITSEGAGANIETAEKVTEQIASQNEALANEAVTRGSLGAKNLLNPNNSKTQTISGITFTVNGDGSVTANGTATNDVYFNVSNNIVIPKGNYKLNGCPSGGSVSTYNIYCEGTDVTVARDTGEGADYNFDSEKTIRCYITIVNGTTVSNITFKPMIRLATDSDPTYQPYSMTNRELTPIAQAVSNRNLLDNPWFTVNQRGQSSYSTNGYTVDRWKINGGLSVTVNADKSLTLAHDTSSGGESLVQYFETDFINTLLGKTITASVEMLDGTIYKATGVMPSTIPSSSTRPFSALNLNNGFALYLSISTSSNYIAIYSSIASQSITIKAVKLELGTVSTLHMDSAPNYAEELLKCQRYFQVIAQGSRWRLDQYGGGGMINISLPIAFRAIPTLSHTNFYLRTMDLQTESVVSGATINPENNYNELLVILGLSGWSTDGQAYLKDGDLWLSADL